MNDEQLLRYSRQIMLPELDIEGQNKLLAATVLIVGLGGLGSPVALYLTAAGVGKLIITDHDEVDLSNLQRQIVHRTDAVGSAKVQSAETTLKSLNPTIAIAAIDHKLDEREMLDILESVDLVLDASDNFETRYFVNDMCWQAGVPLVSGAAIRWEGQVAVFDPRDSTSPCYRCLYLEGDDEALNCAENGVVAALVGVIGTLQAMEAIKLLTGVGDSLKGYVLYYDAKRADWRKLKLSKRAGCPTCSK